MCGVPPFPLPLPPPLPEPLAEPRAPDGRLGVDKSRWPRGAAEGAHVTVSSTIHDTQALRLEYEGKYAPLYRERSVVVKGEAGSEAAC